MKNVLIGALLVLLGGGGAFVYLKTQGSPADPAAEPAAAESGMCAEHEIAEADCPWCDPSLIETMGQCPGHGVPEALCSRCNAALIPGFKAENDWCGGHDLPESQCAICNPELLDAAEEQARVDAAEEQASLPPASVQLVREPEVPRSQRGPRVTCQTDELRIQFLSTKTARDAGLAYARVERREITETLTANAELDYDGNRYAHLSPRAPGVVHEVNADLGQRVDKGSVLAVVDSADLGTAKAAYLQARALVSLWEKNHAREQGLLDRRVGTEREVLEAETKLAESRIALSRAKQGLRTLGLTAQQIQELATEEAPSSLLPLTAPFAGIVVERAARLGEVVDTAAPLFALADTSTMWAIVDVYGSDVARVQPGQAVVLEVEGLRGERRGGRITWVSSHVDRRTRTLKVRAEVANPDGLLRAGMFGKAIVHVRDRAPALVVPRAAVQWEGCCNVVFLRKSDVLFEPRKVRLGYETDRHFVVEDGLQEGDAVVTTGSFLLKTEILKGSIGAGCCEVAPGKS